ncbi:MAG: NAD(P)H-hydrate dehydratase [Saccharofermentanales bacterium]
MISNDNSAGTGDSNYNAISELKRNGLLLMTGAEQRALDKAWTESTGLLLSVLMEQAASAVTTLVLTLLSTRSDFAGVGSLAEVALASDEVRTAKVIPDLSVDTARGMQILVLAGMGQNGGDAWATARQLLAYDLSVSVVDLSEGKVLPPEAAANRQAYLNLDGVVVTANDLVGIEMVPDVIIDGIFGTGFQNRPLTAELNELLAQINRLGERAGAVVAIDIPSGVNADTGEAILNAIVADYTVSFGRPKVGLFSAPGCLFAGKVISAPISMPTAWQEQKLEQALGKDRTIHLAVTKDWLSSRRIERCVDGHKGSFGRGLILGGSPGIPGAVILAARGMMAAGSGYAYVRSVPEILPLLADALPSALISEVGTAAELLQLTGQLEAVACGPGAGGSDWLHFLPNLIESAAQLVLDADALNYVADLSDWEILTVRRAESGLAPAILTPHPLEFLRLAPDLEERLKVDRAGAALALATRSQSIVVLKGLATVTALSSGVCLYNTSGNNGLAKAGSGDVLTGMICSLLAQGYKAEIAAPAAVYIHGLAADLALQKLGTARSITPELLLDYLPQSFKQVDW